MVTTGAFEGVPSFLAMFLAWTKCCDTLSKQGTPETLAGEARYQSMIETLPALTRAFEIARSGKASTMAELRKTLKKEGFPEDALQGGSLTRHLVRLMKDARQGQGVAKAAHAPH
jgi:hypothetical protein